MERISDIVTRATPPRRYWPMGTLSGLAKAGSATEISTRIIEVGSPSEPGIAIFPKLQGHCPKVRSRFVRGRGGFLREAPSQRQQGRAAKGPGPVSDCWRTTLLDKRGHLRHVPPERRRRTIPQPVPGP